jgi:pimeloyl-ACP methyl ester carboxylesterase
MSPAREGAHPLTPYGFTSHYLHLGGNRLHYLDEGPRDGDPVVMLHGNPTWAFFFRRLIASLRADHRVVVPDHMGMGLSDKPADADYDYTLASRVRDLQALLEHLQLARPLTLVLHDWGGMIGLLHGARNPGSIGRLVLLNTAAYHIPAWKRLPWQLAICRLPLLGPLIVRSANDFCRVGVRICIAHRPIDPEVAAGYLYPYNSWRNRIAILRFVQDIPLRPGDRAYALVSEVEAALGQLRRTPALICWGLKDFVFDDRFLAVWRSHLPHAEVHAFADAGHYVLEDAGDEIVRLVRRFLKDSSDDGHLRDRA